jgi:flagellin-like hook-associated protein FlgL
VNEQVGMAAKTDRLEQYAKLNPAAEAQELGEYFEYNIKQSITIGKNQSALVPILQSRIDAEKVTLWTANGSQPPLRALWVKNASGLTLDAGTFNIIDNGTFAGEGLIETVHANERRLLSYAADTGIRITSQFESRDLPVSRVQILKGVMFLTKEHRDNVRYIIRNADTSSRQVVIEHPVREGWKLVNTDKPQETSASHYRFQVAVDPDKTKELAVEEVHQDVSRSMLTEITQHQVEVLATENVMTPELQAAFRRVLDQKAQISKLQSETGTRQMELSAINTDQARIRENMKALRGSVEEKALLLRYTHQLNSQEDRLSLLHKEIKDLEQKQNAEHQKLDDMVQHITL